MKALKYPKTYGIYLGKEAGRYYFSTPMGVISAPHFSRSGSTPPRLKRQWYTLIARKGYQKALELFNIMPIGTQVKLYQKNGRWCYRHVGE